VGFLVLALAVQAWRHERGFGLLTVAAALTPALYALQVIVGAANVWTRLEPALAAAHLGIAAAIWASLVILAASAYHGVAAYHVTQTAPVREMVKES
jgi:heme A synthase